MNFPGVASVSVDISTVAHKESYQGEIRRKWLIVFSLLLLLTVAAILSIGTGSYPIDAGTIITCLFGGEVADTINYLIWHLRLPRAVGAVIAGAGLGLAGTVLQTLLRNPLASPFTLGISQGAAFGATFAIIVLGAGQSHMAGNEGVTFFSQAPVVISAFAGSLVTIVFILVLSGVRNVTTESMILAGVALSAFFGACTMLLQYFADDVQVAATVFWTFGDLGKAGWREVLFMGTALAPAFIYFARHSWSCNALHWGEETAHSLGINVKSLRLTGMLLAGLVVAVTTAFLGIIGFIGLIAPHCMRMFIGNDHRFLLPASLLTGSLLLLCADILSRTLIAPVVLPVGIITSFAGAPLFLYLLITRKRT